MSSRNTQWENIPQTGEGTWKYDQVEFTYNQLLEPLSELPARYNGIGDFTYWTNIDLL